jgi:hypothetical protein
MEADNIIASRSPLFPRFLSKQHADVAFETLTGPAKPDKDGRLQKRVYFANTKDYIQVRTAAA